MPGTIVTEQPRPDIRAATLRPGHQVRIKCGPDVVPGGWVDRAAARPLNLLYSSTLIRESLISFAHFGISELMIVLNSSGELPITSMPACANLSRTSDDASALTISDWSLRTIVEGVFAGASRPPQIVTSKPGMPAS